MWATAAAEPQNTVYVPERHKVDDLPLLHAFMDEFAFVDLVTTAPDLRITHIPILLDRGSAGQGTLLGHVARNNPQSQALTAQAKATIVFHGPHDYISPSWYASQKGVVPTWNFAAVHASGTLRPIEDKKRLRGILARLIAKFESQVKDSSYRFDDLPDSYVGGMLAGIVGFEMPIDTLEGKFKLGQERSEADQQGVLSGLAKARPERNLAAFTRAFLARR